MKVIVDTNVAIVANGKASQASATCIDACVVILEQIIQTGILVLDTQWLILSEYEHALHPSGQPGVGDRFYRWVLVNRTNPTFCELTPVTRRSGSYDPTDLNEFPADPELAKFDRADRKFVALALAHPEKPPILNAVDTDWWIHRAVLTRHGVQLQFVCPDAMPQNG